MKAIEFPQYGAPEVLQFNEIEKPKPQDNEVLIIIKATTVTSADCRIRSLNVPFGFKLITRLVFGFNKPKKTILGVEFSGVIEEKGKDVKQFAIGDHVFGSSDKFGCHAEYIALAEDGVIAIKPNNMTFEEAAAVPFGALSSLVYLRDFGKIQDGQKVLINGASGCLGTYAVQLAKNYGAEVTGVCSTSNIDMVKSLGADNVIDYTQDDFTNNNEQYDIIFDTVGKIYFSHCKKSLTKNGRFLMAAAGLPQYIQVLITMIFSKKKSIGGMAIFKKNDLHFIQGLIEEDKIKAVIDKRFPLDQADQAHKYVDKGHKKGNVVLIVGEK